MIRFGTDGWRDLMTADFNESNVRKVAAAIAAYVSGVCWKDCRGVVIGYDTRRNSNDFAEICGQVLRDNNIEVIGTPRPLPTPVIAYAVKKKHAFGAIMITASHNPPDYNGIKFISKHGGPSDTSATSEIEKFIGRVYLQAEPGIADDKKNFFQMYDPFDDYRNHLKQLVDYQAIKKSRLRIVVDPNFGAGYGLLDKILKEDGEVEVIAVNNYADSQFGNGIPDPSGDNLKRLASEVVENNADIGIALDGDADRFAVVDASGFSPVQNICISIIADHLAEKGLKGKVIRTVATTHMLDKIAEHYDFPLIETKVGFKYIAEEMLEGDVLVGGEESGGISIGNHIPEKDGFLGNLLLIEALACKKTKSVSSLVEKLFAKYGRLESRRKDFHVSDDNKQRIISYLNKFAPVEINGKKITDIKKIDGFKFYLEDGSWVMIRASGTEPVLRVYAESVDKENTDTLISFAQNKIIEHKEKALAK